MVDSLMTGCEMDDDGIPKLLFYSTIFQGPNPPSSIISSLLVFLAKCIKYLVLYIMKNQISKCMWDILSKQKVEFDEAKHEN
jgi:hypothetical protein